ncbi:MAG TPA: ABC transporter permease [Bryobacteraceae bacterium]|jgi:predicted permease
MRTLRAVWMRVLGMFGRLDSEFSAEIESHVQMHIDDNLRAGMSREEARRAALMKLGGVTQVKEAYRERRGLAWVDHLMQDLRYGMRQLRRNPGFTVVAVLSLALGIGANTAIFTLLDQVLLRSLPVKNPQALVRIAWQGQRSIPSIGLGTLPYPYYREIRDRSGAFDGALAQFPVELSFAFLRQSGGAETEHLQGELVSGDYFDVLGVGAAMGRVFNPGDDVGEGAHPVAVLSYDFWVERFGADPGVVGKTILANNVPLTVIGVSAKGFEGMDLALGTKIRIPISMAKQFTGFFGNIWNLENRQAAWVQVFARLKEGVTKEQARARLDPLFRGMIEADAAGGTFFEGTPQQQAYAQQKFRATYLEVTPGARGFSRMRQRYENPLRVLMGLVALVLLMAALNVANLLLARGAARSREIAVRLALGADRGRLARQSLAESALLTLLGGAAGVALAIWADRLLIALIPAGDDHLQLNTSPDLRVLAFTLAVCAAAGLLFGLLPAWSAARFDISTAVREHGRAGAGSPRLRRALVVGQVFLSALLFLAAGSFVRSLANLRTVDPGFQTDRVDTFSIAADLNGYRKERAVTYYRQLAERLRAVPGVEKVGIAALRVVDGDWWGQAVGIEGYQASPSENMTQAFNLVSRDYFAAMGQPILEGRDFQVSDAGSRHAVAVVNQTFAKKYFAGRSAIGRGMMLYGSRMEIVGMVKDSRYERLRDAPPSQVFLDFDQNDDPAGHFVVVKSSAGAGSMAGVLREAVRSVDPNVPVYAMRTLEEQVDRSIATERLVAGLAAGFGGVAAVLAAVGLYGLMAFNVARRTTEIGVRMALGARRGTVSWLVLREVVVLVGIGAVAAVPVGIGLWSMVRAQLYGVDAGDPVMLGVVVAGLVGAAMVAGVLPVRRAARVEPMVALRHE